MHFEKKNEKREEERKRQVLKWWGTHPVSFSVSNAVPHGTGPQSSHTHTHTHTLKGKKKKKRRILTNAIFSEREKRTNKRNAGVDHTKHQITKKKRLSFSPFWHSLSRPKAVKQLEDKQKGRIPVGLFVSSSFPTDLWRCSCCCCYCCLFVSP